MGTDTVAADDIDHRDDDRAIWDRLPILMLAAAVIGAVVAGAIVWRVVRPDTPGDDSPEAGFARDMSTHHAQAVEMASIIRDTTQNEEIHTIATDIILTQQAQFGIMHGWLDVWNVSRNGDGPPMAWAGMRDGTVGDVNGRMAGMATAGDINALRGMSGSEADREFLTLMIAHHNGGVMMARAALDASDNDDVTRLAGAIAAAQQIEIDLLERLLAEIA